MLEFMKVEILTFTEHLLEQLKIIELSGRVAYLKPIHLKGVYHESHQSA